MSRSLFEGVRPSVEALLGIRNLKHRSALLQLGQVSGLELVKVIFDQMSGNYERCGAAMRKDRSRENWRWQSLQPQISPHNRSPEVSLERAIARAALALGRNDWANQIPVASGLVEGGMDGRRAIDLVRKRGDDRFEFIELKIGSDTPLYATIELFEYTSLFLLARRDRPTRASELLDAKKVHLSVLAPSAYFSRYSLGHLQRELNRGAVALGAKEGIALSFSFDSLHEHVVHPLPEHDRLLDLLDLCGKIT